VQRFIGGDGNERPVMRQRGEFFQILTVAGIVATTGLAEVALAYPTGCLSDAFSVGTTLHKGLQNARIEVLINGL